jgi:hypothetical protein
VQLQELSTTTPITVENNSNHEIRIDQGIGCTFLQLFHIEDFLGKHQEAQVEVLVV